MEPFEVEESTQESKIPGSAVVKITPEKRQLIGLRTGIVKYMPFHKTIRAVGKVDYAEPLLAYVNTKFEGWVNKLHVDFTGQYVKKGQSLLEVYSPELLATQNEFLLAMKNKKVLQQSNVENAFENASSLLETVRQRLKLWDISDSQIDKLEQTGETTKTLIFYAPISGFVVDKNVLLGQRIMPGDNLYKIADLSKVWIYGEIYEYEMSLIKSGQEVQITFVAYPGEEFKGKLSYIYPYLKEDTRTIRVRIESANPEFRMKPEMYANIEIHVDLGLRLAVPIDAVLDSGEKKIIFIDKGNGYIEPRQVKIALSADNMYEIINGVSEGEKIITSAQFLIDSESSLNAALEAMKTE
ncbi:MAG: hypothetical protein A2Y62_01905 [Candidatus Fischerbacteria bacterium RBG_13_37_8]|uniref:Uncharacterized protein n=1 Tax=Candidatus Fischerbacteria bacterium RBG_13_37_8 TaxID=1817863 RepID=A0A1F5VJS3_9BACT|nr:MAG: hypothetical protein A2Y62_01905 [Candidatus Fischerbacteria bacterium RBG_13_37_8]